jgi:regulator of sigma E protease
VGGFMAIGNLFPGAWDWQSFWSLTAFLSIMLAILNILPIPALDGGHVLFLLIEIISGRKPSEKVMEIAQYIGFFLLLALIVYANLNDVLKLF